MCVFLRESSQKETSEASFGAILLALHANACKFNSGPPKLGQFFFSGAKCRISFFLVIFSLVQAPPCLSSYHIHLFQFLRKTGKYQQRCLERGGMTAQGVVIGGLPKKYRKLQKNCGNCLKTAEKFVSGVRTFLPEGTCKNFT